MGSNKLAVVFPGIGYHVDKPLLYVTRRLAREKGFEIIEISYDFSFKAREIKDNEVRMKDAFLTACEQTEKQLEPVEFGKYTKVLFIGKSIGTAVAARYDREHGIGATQLVLTPVPQTFDYLRPGCGLVYHGLSDPWCGNELVREKCAELGLELREVEGANHSLETASALSDAINMQVLVERVEKLFDD